MDCSLTTTVENFWFVAMWHTVTEMQQDDSDSPRKCFEPTAVWFQATSKIQIMSCTVTDKFPEVTKWSQLFSCDKTTWLVTRWPQYNHLWWLRIGIVKKWPKCCVTFSIFLNSSESYMCCFGYHLQKECQRSQLSYFFFLGCMHNFSSIDR